MAESNPTEKWLPIAGYEGIYEISDHGRARSVDRYGADGRKLNGHIMKPSICKRGYVRFHLFKKHSRTFSAHRLVLEAFVGPCPDGMDGCHFPDRNPRNCRLNNLRWDTRKANFSDRDRHGTTARGEKQGLSKLCDTDIYLIRSIAKTCKQRDIAEWFNISRWTVNQIIYEKTWTHLL